MMNSISASSIMAKFYNVGHRGASAYRPENTIASLEEAVLRRADMIEFDLRRTADGAIVLFHDWGLKMESGRRKAISRITFNELDRVTRSRGYELALFKDVLRLFGSRIALNIEIKVGGFEDEVVRLIHKDTPVFGPTLSSFFPCVLSKLKDTDLKTALILGQERVRRLNILARPMVQKAVSRLGIRSIHLQEKIVSPAVVKNLAEAGVTVFVWTVDDPDNMRRLLKMGVDGIITNKPDLLYQVCLQMADAREPILRKTRAKFGRFAYAM
jgi:glycerophosphoryl diester phosphodiesterase